MTAAASASNVTINHTMADTIRNMVQDNPHFLDMLRTAVNMTGDAIYTLIVSFKTKALDVDIFNGKKAPEKTSKLEL